MTADPIVSRRGPLGGGRDSGDGLDLAGPSLRVVDEPFRSLAEVRVRGADPATVEDVLRSSVGPDAHVWRLGPTWWLVDAAPEPVAALESALAGRLRSALAGLEPAGGSTSVVDTSAQRTVIVVSGADARRLLAYGCPIDLDPRVVGAGECVQGHLARAQVAIGVVDHGPGRGLAYRVHVRASFARYLADWITDAAVEHL